MLQDLRASVVSMVLFTLILGLAYKKNVDDTRESPAFKLIELLEKRGATFAAHALPLGTFPGAAAASLLGINALWGLFVFALAGGAMTATVLG